MQALNKKTKSPPKHSIGSKNVPIALVRTRKTTVPHRTKPVQTVKKKRHYARRCQTKKKKLYNVGQS